SVFGAGYLIARMAVDRSAIPRYRWARSPANAWLSPPRSSTVAPMSPTSTAPSINVRISVTPALAGRTITVGAASKELRMIGWRVGWVGGPAQILRDINLVGLTNVVCQVGIAQEAVAAALTAPDAAADVARATAVWKARRDTIIDQLAGYPVIARTEAGRCSSIPFPWNCPQPTPW